MVESAVAQVGEGAGNPQTDGGSSAEMPHKGKITASMREYKFRRGEDSELLRQEVQESLSGVYPGVLVSVASTAIYRCSVLAGGVAPFLRMVKEHGDVTPESTATH